MKYSSKFGAALAAVAVTAVTTLGVSTNAVAADPSLAASPSDPSFAALTAAADEAVPAKWQEVVASDTPKTIVLDTATGKVLSVEESAGGASVAAITVHSPCQGYDACWFHNSIPYPDYGFAGTGTKTGTWTNRNRLDTRGHSTSACWVGASGTLCTPRVGTNSSLQWNSYPVTGKSVTNYS